MNTIKRTGRSFVFAGSFMALAIVGIAQAQDQAAQPPVDNPPVVAVEASVQEGVAPAEGQPEAAGTEVTAEGQAQDSAQEILVMPPEDSVDPNNMSSLLFTYWEHTAIRDARRMRGMARAPTEEELARDLKTGGPGAEGEKVKPPPEEREIALGGIVYTTQDDWTIWLNGKRVTPAALPKEALDLKVHDHFIEVKWFDEYSNQIFPIRLRSHQRFNMDMRIFLPG